MAADLGMKDLAFTACADGTTSLWLGGELASLKKYFESGKGETSQLHPKKESAVALSSRTWFVHPRLHWLSGSSNFGKIGEHKFNEMRSENRKNSHYLTIYPDCGGSQCPSLEKYVQWYAAYLGQDCF